MKNSCVLALVIFSLVTFSIKSVAATATTYDAVVYLITGGPFEAFNPADVEAAWVDTGKQIVEQNSDLKIKIVKIHQTAWKNGVTDIKNLYAANKKLKVVLMGHSFGAQRAVEISKGIQSAGITVAGLLTIDTVALNPFDLTTPLSIPANVTINYLYRQDGDPFLQGSGDNYQKDGHTVIHNYVQTLGYVPVGSHMSAMTHLYDYGILQVFAAATLHGFTNPEVEAVMATANIPYFEKYPPETPKKRRH